MGKKNKDYFTDADEFEKFVLQAMIEDVTTMSKAEYGGFMTKVALEGTMHVEAIKMRVGQAIIEHGIEGLKDGLWFNMREDATSRQQEISLGYNEGDMYKATQASLINQMPSSSIPSSSNSGAYGTFFENLFFGGGAGNDPIPDFRYSIDGVSHGIEIKTSILRDVYGAIDSNFFTHTVGKTTSPRKELDRLVNANNRDDEKISTILQSVILLKMYNKMKNLLVAGYSKNTVDGVILDTNVGRFVESKGTFYFTALFLYVHLLVKKVYDYLTKNIIIQKKAINQDTGEIIEQVDIQSEGQKRKTVGGEYKDSSGQMIPTKNLRAKVEQKTLGGTFDLENISVLITVKNLPETSEEIEKAIRNDPEHFYADIRILFDDVTADNTAKKFFEEAMTLFKQADNAGNVRRNNGKVTGYGNVNWIK